MGTIGSSAAVNTATTPGMAWAALVSMPLIRAWATVARTNARWTMPGMVMSPQ